MVLLMWPLEFDDQNIKLIRKICKKFRLSKNVRLAVISFIMKDKFFSITTQIWFLETNQRNGKAIKSNLKNFISTKRKKIKVNFPA